MLVVVHCFLRRKFSLSVLESVILMTIERQTLSTLKTDLASVKTGEGFYPRQSFFNIFMYH